MNLTKLIERVKAHPRFAEAGMILCHNGVVRGTSRDGRTVTGLRVQVDHDRLAEVIAAMKAKAGIIEILVEINEGKELSLGDDVMFLVVAGDIRDRVIPVFEETLNAIKSTVTRKTEY